jgi:thiamine-phosphate pyrophosphorylase
MDCQLYLVMETGEAALERLAAALAATRVASVLIVPVAGATLQTSVAQALIQSAQRAGAAALVADDAGLARSLGADGVHLRAGKDAAKAYATARGTVGRQGIVGVDAGISRHDAMALAEAGADYIAFGAPAHLKDREKARDRRDELIAWWAEIFETPCVAFDVETPAEAETLASAGADFVALTLPAGAAPAETRSLVAAIAVALCAPAAAG